MSKQIWGDQSTQFFFNLTPSIVLDGVESVGFKTTGRCLALNSMENRVYEVEIELTAEEKANSNSPSDNFKVVKFYRPARWTKEQILEEHEFLFDLIENDIPVVAPLKINGASLFECEQTNLFFTVFPKRGGRIPDEMNHEQIEMMGRMLARLHNVGATKKAKHRLEICPNVFATQNLQFLLDSKSIPPHYEDSYKNLVEKIVEISEPFFKDITKIRIHGDCHWGNVIWRDEEGPSFVDFDDMLVGPAVQDLWLTVPGLDQESMIKRNLLIDSYQQFRDFDHRETKLIEPLRAMRFIHFTTWISKRWEDPSFKNSFPQYGTEEYWQTQTNDLRHQISLIEQSTTQYY